MKLFAARQADYSDLVVLWPVCGFDSRDRAVAEMREAFPAAPEDKHLVAFVADLARERRSHEHVKHRRLAAGLLCRGAIGQLGPS
jgi:hypothetical protein